MAEYVNMGSIASSGSALMKKRNITFSHILPIVLPVLFSFVSIAVITGFVGPQPAIASESNKNAKILAIYFYADW